MKRIKKILLPILILFSVVGCGENNTPSTSISLTPSKWGEQYTELIVGNLGEDIPYMEAPSFDIELSEDDFGDPLVCIYMYYPEDEIQEMLDVYSGIVMDEGYSVEYGQNAIPGDDGFSTIIYSVYYADKIISSSKGIELQFLEGSHKGIECMGIFAYGFVYDDPHYWPTNLVTSLLGHDIPHLEDDGSYEYYSKINVEGYIDMIIYNVSYTAEDDYAELLISNNYEVSEQTFDEYTGEYMGRFAFSKDDTHAVQFGLSQYGLEIYIYKLV